MNIRGLGVDIAEVKRFRHLPYKKNKSFYDKIFTVREIKYCLAKSDPAQHFAARFAAKEAIAKAIGKSVYNAKKIEILNDKNGRPKAKFQVLVSLSHTENYAIAFAIATNG